MNQHRPQLRTRTAITTPTAWPTGRGAIPAVLLAVVHLLASRIGGDDDRDRGDVPGWVMITLMSAVLVAALLAIAAPALQGLFEQAIQQVQPRR